LLGSCPASDFVELLGATRAETSGLARCHGAVLAASYRTGTVCAKDPGV